MSEAGTEQKALPPSDWRKAAKEKESSKPTMGVIRLAVVDGQLIEGENTVLKEGLEALPLAAIYARAYYLKAYKKPVPGAPPALPDCYSTSLTRDFAGVSPEANSPNIQAESCETCPLGSWDKSGWEPDQKAPKCGTRRNVVLKSLESGKIYRLSVPPTGVKAFDQYWTGLSGPLAATTVKITAAGKIPAFEKKVDLTFDQYVTQAEPYIGEAERVLRAPIDYEAAKSQTGGADSGSEAPITPGKPAPAAPAGKPRF